jgi:hypothetical protein
MNADERQSLLRSRGQVEDARMSHDASETTEHEPVPPTSPGAPIESGLLDDGVALRDAMDGA